MDEKDLEVYLERARSFRSAALRLCRDIGDRATPYAKGAGGAPGPLPRLDPYRNQWERDYADHLELRRAAGEIFDWRYEAVRWKYGSSGWYKTDFWIVFPGHFEAHDVKGFMRPAALARMKAVALQYPWFRWATVSKSKDGCWEVKYIS